MTRIVSPRFQVSYPDPALRDEDADVPGDLALLVAGLELAAKYGQGTLGARPAPSATAPTVYYATDEGKVYWNTGSAWITIGPPGVDSITAVHIAAGAIGASELADNAVDTAAIQNDAVTSDKIAANAVGSSEIATNAVGADELADNSVDSPAIVAGAVTETKIGAGAVTATKIGTDAVLTSHIAPNAVGASELADSSVDGAAIQGGVITPGHFAPLASITLRRTAVQGIGAGFWQDLFWNTQTASEGSIFWNGNQAFDLLAAGWHHITCNVAFDTLGEIGIRLLDMSAGGQVIAQEGIVGMFHSAASVLSMSYEENKGPTEYVVQIFNSGGGAVTLWGQLPLLTARVER